MVYSHVIKAKSTYYVREGFFNVNVKSFVLDECLKKQRSSSVTPGYKEVSQHCLMSRVHVTHVQLGKSKPVREGGNEISLVHSSELSD